MEEDETQELREILRAQIDALSNDPESVRKIVASQQHILQGMVDFKQLQTSFLVLVQTALLKEHRIDAGQAMAVLFNAMTVDAERLYYASGSLYEKAKAFLNYYYDPQTSACPDWHEMTEDRVRIGKPGPEQETPHESQ